MAFVETENYVKGAWEITNMCENLSRGKTDCDNYEVNFLHRGA